MDMASCIGVNKKLDIKAILDRVNFMEGEPNIMEDQKLLVVLMMMTA